MKKSLIAAAVLAVSFAAPAAFAETVPDSDMGTLIINGFIKGTTCHFANGAQSAEIPMNQIGLDAMTGLTAATASRAAKILFIILSPQEKPGRGCRGW